MNSSTGRVVAICLSEGGIPRLPVDSAELTLAGFQGDGHRYDEHYAQERAVTLFNWEILQQFDVESQPFPPGSVGENISLSGVDLAELEPGTRLSVGQAEILLVKRWRPCHATEAASGRTCENGQQWKGYFASVLRPGEIHPGDSVRVISSR
ncbi:MOSC domain-containing protein [bacterium]|nr:MOSC domain-containing protein [bacterium]